MELKTRESIEDEWELPAADTHKLTEKE